MIDCQVAFMSLSRCPHQLAKQRVQIVARRLDRRSVGADLFRADLLIVLKRDR
jgi:hypothetical protein